MQFLIFFVFLSFTFAQPNNGRSISGGSNDPNSKLIEYVKSKPTSDKTASDGFIEIMVSYNVEDRNQVFNITCRNIDTGKTYNFSRIAGEVLRLTGLPMGRYSDFKLSSIESNLAIAIDEVLTINCGVEVLPTSELVKNNLETTIRHISSENNLFNRYAAYLADGSEYTIHPDYLAYFPKINSMNDLIHFEFLNHKHNFRTIGFNDVVEKPKKVDYNNKSAKHMLGVTEFFERNYEGMMFMDYYEGVNIYFMLNSEEPYMIVELEDIQSFDNIRMKLTNGIGVNGVGARDKELAMRYSDPEKKAFRYMKISKVWSEFEDSSNSRLWDIIFSYDQEKQIITLKKKGNVDACMGKTYVKLLLPNN